MISKEQINISNFEEEKYLQIISSEEKKGNVFNNLVEDFFCSEENLVNEICDKLENGNKYKKWLRVLGYFIGALVVCGTHILLDALFSESIDFSGALISAIIYTIIIIWMNKKYTNNKD